jgi:hypothetical protein
MRAALALGVGLALVVSTAHALEQHQQRVMPRIESVNTRPMHLLLPPIGPLGVDMGMEIYADDVILESIAKKLPCAAVSRIVVLEGDNDKQEIDHHAPISPQEALELPFDVLVLCPATCG